MLLEKLANAFGPPGQEQEVRGLIQQEAGQRECRAGTDSMGNLYVWPKTQATDRKVDLLLVAHMDEVGVLVTGHHETGLLRFRSLGGIDSRLLPGKTIQLGPQGIPGIVGMDPVHLGRAASEARVPADRDLFIDIGAREAREARNAVPAGTGGVFHAPWRELPGGRVTGKAFDNRAGCAAILEILALSPFSISVGAAFTVQEELGLRGSRVAGRHFRTRQALILETTTAADVPNHDRSNQVTRLGEGPALTQADGSTISHPETIKMIQELACRKGISLQFKETTRGSTDGGPIQQEGGGVPTTVISIPCRYLHGPGAIMDLADYRALLHLLTAFLEEGANVF